MKNALLCFLKFPEPGHVKTRLAVDLSEQAAAELYESMAERVITEVYPLEGSYDLILWVDPAHELLQYQQWLGHTFEYRGQRGPDLGERLEHAVAQTFEAGYERVAVIGSDCVGMDQDLIEDVFESLAMVDYVVGPSTDGGYYLLAMKEFSPWLFRGVEWSTNSVLDTTVDKIEMRELKFRKLDEKVDVDDLESLIHFKAALPEEHFLSKKIDLLVMNHVSVPSDDAQKILGR